MGNFAWRTKKFLFSKLTREIVLFKFNLAEEKFPVAMLPGICTHDSVVEPDLKIDVFFKFRYKKCIYGKAKIFPGFPGFYRQATWPKSQFSRF